MGKYALDLRQNGSLAKVTALRSEGQVFYSLLLQAWTPLDKLHKQNLWKKSDADDWSEHDDTCTDSESEMLIP